MSLSPRDLEYFLDTARSGQLCQAAANRDVTPAALSKAIRRLENELGLQLFERVGNGMRLTPFGESFRVRALRLMAEHDDAMRYAGEVRAGRAGLLRIGATHAVLSGSVFSALAHLQPHRPGMRVSMTVAKSDELLDKVHRGSLDACVVPTYSSLPNGLDQTVLGFDALVPIARKGHPILQENKPTLGRLAELSWALPMAPSAARSRLDALFRQGGAQIPVAAVEIDFSMSLVLPLVEATDLVALAPQSALGESATRGIQFIEPSDLRLERTISLFSRPDLHRSPLMQEFMGLLLSQGARKGLPTETKTRSSIDGARKGRPT